MPLTQLKRLFRRSQPVAGTSTKPFVRPHINIGYGNDRSDGVNSLQELLEFNARHNPDHIFCTQLTKNRDDNSEGIFGAPHNITFIQLLHAVERASAWLVKKGFTSGRKQRTEDIAPVGILLSSDITIFIYMAALMRIGTPVLLLSARLTSPALEHLIEETSPSCILVNSDILERAALEAVEGSSKKGHLTNGTPKITRALGYEAFLNPRYPDILGVPIPAKYIYSGHEDANAIIFHSSGTTGLPKSVSHSHAYLLIIATCHRLQDYRGSQGSLCTLPLYHGYALLPTSLSMSLGIPLFLMPLSTVPTGRSTADTLKTCKPSFLFTVPSILDEMVSLPNGEGLEALRRLDILPAGGAPMKESVGDRLRQEGIKYLNHWGCTELGPMTPIEVPDLSVDWRWLRPRTDHSLKVTPCEDNKTHFQISGQLPGWGSVFRAQDTLIIDPSNPHQYKLGGRNDDLILLSTGEKVLPTAIEYELLQHPQVKEVCAFGEGQVALGVIVELKNDMERDTFLEGIGPYLDRGNASMDKHGKVQLEMIIITSEDTKPLLRTDKNSLARKASLAAFREEIASCYTRSNNSSIHSISLPSLRSGDCQARLCSVREIVTSILDYDGIDDSSDIFEAGMDSYQANRLRRGLEASLNSPSSSSYPEVNLEKDFCFQNPTINKLHQAIEKIIANRGSPSRASDNADRISTMLTMLEKYRQPVVEFLSSVTETAATTTFNDYSIPSTILITGSTGSLGCYLLPCLARQPDVKRVICLSRRCPDEAPADRQRRLMTARGATMNDSLWSKVSVYGADYSQENFGLGEFEYQELLQVTHVIHTAWPVNFNRTLHSFEQQIRIVSDLIRLAHTSTRRTHPTLQTRLAFISSIAVAGCYTSGEVPEERLPPESTLPMGYAEAKWVAEALLLAAAEQSQTLETPTFKSSIMRIGQISGAEDSGAWNQAEQIPLMMTTSQMAGCLPAIEGTLSWLPVNRAAQAICDLLFSDSFHQFNHVENPSRQHWNDVIQDLSQLLRPSKPLPVVPFAEWLIQVRSLGGEDELITHIMDFLERDFGKLGCGGVVLSTQNSQAASVTLAKSGPVDRTHLNTYANVWRKEGP